MFTDVHHALSFAFRVTNTPILKGSSINSMRGPTGNSELSQHDKHAQAAIIMSIVEQTLDVQGLAYVYARYGGVIRQDSQKKSAVVGELVKAAIAGLPTGIHGRRGIVQLVEKYFGCDYSMISIRKELRCKQDRTAEYRELVYGAMDRVGRRAEDAVHRALEATGIINPA